ncbi:MAG: hypothetical protein HYZ49_21035 [Chloroflexi bacterium]|nr:hypothetical protein [Chloroflexota bacterium]
MMTSTRRWRLGWRENWLRAEPPDWRSALAVLAGALLLWPLTHQLPMLGFDWRVYFWARDFRQYPPWIEWALAPLLALPWRTGLAGLNALLLMTVAVSVAREVFGGERRPAWRLTSNALGCVLLALFTPPTMILLWVGNIEAVALWGMLMMPVGIPWVLLKPHLGLWAVLSRRSWIIWAAAFGLLTLVVWQFWPTRVLGSVTDRIQHPSAFGWASLGWPMIAIGLTLLAQTPPDPLALMAAGSFLSPFLMPQHFVLLLPALGRVKGTRRLILWAGTWLLLIPLIFNSGLKWLALGFPALVWWMLRAPPVSKSAANESPE